jgi:LysR family cyn operon transcriptional activator
MELRHLRYFIALAERLSFTRAAAQVHVTQSTLSHQIKKLEDEIGQSLFKRVGKRVIMTEAGELLLPSVTRALAEIDSGIRLIQGAGHQLAGHLRIGATHTFSINLVPTCIAALLARNPSVKISVWEHSAAGIEEGLRRETLDVGISYRPRDTAELRFEPLYEEEMVLVVSRAHPLASRKRVRMFELHRQPVVLLTADFATRIMLDDWFASVGAAPLIVAEMNAIAPMLGVVRRMQVGTIVARLAVPEGAGLVSIGIESPTPVRTPGILWKVKDQDQSIVNSFAAVVRGAVLTRNSSSGAPRRKSRQA